MSSSDLRLGIRRLTLFLVLLPLLSCSPAASSLNDEPETNPVLKIMITGPVDARWEEALGAWQVSLDVTIRNPSVYDITVDRVWVVIKDEYGRNASVGAIDLEWLRDFWGEPVVRARSSRQFPAQFVGNRMPKQPDRGMVEVWVEGRDDHENDVRAKGTKYGGIRLRGLQSLPDGELPPVDRQ